MSITFEDLQKANESIRTTDIKGKEYAEVNQRIKAFRMVYPTGFIVTKDFNDYDGVCIIRKQVGYYDENGNAIILADSTAYEKEGSTFINKTSYIENCDTSATGRALGMAGFGIDVSVASAEEVQNAMANQNKTETITKKQFEDLKKNFTSEEIKAMFEELNISRGTDMPLEYYTKKNKEWLEKHKSDFAESQEGFY